MKNNLFAVSLVMIALFFGGAAVFMPFPNASTFVKTMLFIVGYVIWDAAYTMANVPYGAMLSLITKDAGERAQLSTWRSISSLVGSLLPNTILPILIWKNVYDGDGQLLGQELKGTSAEVAHRACWLIAGLYLFSAVMQFVGIGVIFNLDRKTLSEMNDDLNARKAKAEQNPEKTLPVKLSEAFFQL